MYYHGVIVALRVEIEKRQPHSCPEYSEVKTGQIAPLSYLLWMCDEIEKMDTQSGDQARKAARWIGWMLAHAEIIGLWDNERSRELVRVDRVRGLDNTFHAD